jgi:hypothetical protein
MADGTKADPWVLSGSPKIEHNARSNRMRAI